MGRGEPAGPASVPLSDPAAWVEEYGTDLLRYALVRVGDRETARDLVQEALLAALRGRTAFAGRSSVKTWLTGILRHKILDHFRTRARNPAAPGADPETESFGEDGRWRAPPEVWAPDPSEEVLRRQFWDALRRCLAELPPRQASAFSLREFEGMETAELCKALGATPTNLWVILHRARLGLRRCLEGSGFGAGTPEGVR